MSEIAAAFFVAGGTLPASAPSYIARAADHELAELLAELEFVYVLDTRQIGKSSLVTRASETLRSNGIRVALVDLTRAGNNLQPNQWYMSLLGRVDESLRLDRACVRAYSAEPDRAPMERFFEVLEKVAAADSPLVVVVDEIDVVLSLPFSADEFFIGIRECFIRRSSSPDLERLSFCLVGSASPASLIRDARITPFNIGKRVEPTDFTLVELAPYVIALNDVGRDGNSLVRRVHFWTSGHPYLTQLLCGEIARDPSIRTIRDIDTLVHRLFFAASAAEADHLALTARRILESPEGLLDRASLLDLLRKLLRERSLRDDPADPKLTLLKLAGIARSAGGRVSLRNRIYESHFSYAWIQENMPDAELRRQRAAAKRAVLKTASIAAVILLLVGALGVNSARLAGINARLADHLARSLDESRRHAAAETAAHRDADNEKAEVIAKSLEVDNALKTARESAAKEKIAADNAIKKGMLALSESQLAERESRERGIQAKLAQAAESRARASEALARGDEEVAKRNLREAQRYTYIASMQTIQNASDYGNYPLIVSALAETEKLPDKGWEWGYWHRLMNLQVRLPQRGAVSSAEFSRDGTRIVTGGWDDKTARIWDAESGRQILELKGHTEGILSASFSLDGSRIFTTSFDKTSRVWDARSGRQLSLSKNGGGYTVFSPDGKCFLANAADAVNVWSSADGKELFAINKFSNLSPRGKFSFDGTHILAFDSEGFEVCDAKSGKVVAKQAQKGEQFIEDASFSPDGKKVAIINVYCACSLWDAVSGKKIAQISPINTIVDYCEIHFSPDGQRILITSQGAGDIASLWDVADSKQIATMIGQKGCFSPDGARVVTANGIGTVTVWDAHNGGKLETLKGHLGHITDQAFSPDGFRIVISASDGSVVWDATSRENVTLRGHRDEINSAQLSHDGKRIVTASRDKTARIWAASDGRLLTTLTGHSSVVISAAFSSDAKTVLTTSFDDSTRLWDSATGRERLERKGINSEDMFQLHPAAFSTDGKRFVTVTTNDYAAHVWDAASGKEVSTLLGHKGVLSAVVFSPDSSRILTAGFDGQARIWDAASGKQLALLITSDYVNQASFSPDSKRIVFSSNSEDAEVWDVTTGKKLLLLKGHTGSLSCASFSPDGLRIVTAGGDRTARVWDAATGKQLLVLEGHSDWLASAEFSPDGSRILTSSSDGTARLYDALKGKELLVLRISPVGSVKRAGANDQRDYAASFSSDGSRILTRSLHGGVEVWYSQMGDGPPYVSGLAWHRREAEQCIDVGALDVAEASLNQILASGHLIARDAELSNSLADAYISSCLRDGILYSKLAEFAHRARKAGAGSIQLSFDEGLAELLAGNEFAARETLADAEKGLPNADPASVFLIADLAEFMQDPPGAQDLYNRIDRLRKGNETQDDFGGLKLRLGQLDDSKAELEKLRGRNFFGLGWLALVEERQGNHSQALRDSAEFRKEAASRTNLSTATQLSLKLVINELDRVVGSRN